MAFSVENLEICLEHLIKNGGTMLGKVMKRQIDSVGQIHVVYAKDPEGNIVEI
jgi:lactoylglutathione lyase